MYAQLVRCIELQYIVKYCTAFVRVLNRGGVFSLIRYLQHRTYSNSSFKNKANELNKNRDFGLSNSFVVGILNLIQFPLFKLDQNARA